MKKLRLARASLTDYYHLGLSTHDVVLAEGLAGETYLDTGDRMAFANGGARQLHPDFGQPLGFPYMMREAFGYPPLRIVGAEVERVRAWLEARAGMLSGQAVDHAACHASW